MEVEIPDRKNFRWNTMDGRVLSLEEMSTKHIFNSMKMIYNHVAEVYGLVPIWYMHKYVDYRVHAKTIPRELMRIMLIFMAEIEQRGNLPTKYEAPYNHILGQLAKSFDITINRLTGRQWTWKPQGSMLSDMDS